MALRSVNLTDILTVTRSGDAWRFNSSGLLESVPANTARLDYGLGGSTCLGLLIEEQRTNLVLHNRDLTQAAWTATNATVAKDQTGIDGVANSASSITATAGNATVLQAIANGSSARFQTAYVKRLAGAGVVEMTMDNGATWTAVTVTNDWTRVSIPTQTLANPTVGFRIVTSGDSIAVDVVQNENGAFATSPIITTTASGVRTADVALASTLGAWFNPSAGTLFAHASAVQSTTQNSGIVSFDNGSSNNRIMIRRANSGTNGYAYISDGGVAQAFSTQVGAFATGDTAKMAIAWAANDVAICANGGAVATDNSATIPTVDRFRVGIEPGSSFTNGHIKSVVYFPTRLDNATLQALTS